MGLACMPKTVGLLITAGNKQSSQNTASTCSDLPPAVCFTFFTIAAKIGLATSSGCATACSLSSRHLHATHGRVMAHKPHLYHELLRGKEHINVTCHVAQVACVDGK